MYGSLMLDSVKSVTLDFKFGDGSGGGGIALAGTPWDKKALEIAEEVALSFDGELGIYAFKTQKNAHIQVRVERLTNKSGSPSMADIEAFSSAYRERLDEAESSGSIPNNLSLEVSSPGVERVVRVPEDLDRFKERPMYVKYVSEGIKTGTPTEHDGVFRLVSFDLETSVCTWGLADVRVNREKAGKGRPLSKKQREWRLDTPFDSLRMVRLHSEM
nr:Ribosome maturation factor RimP like [Ipomoea batatas]GME15694.1 Ribosome maturation factor RimP like [Ipomoea batatas]